MVPGMGPQRNNMKDIITSILGLVIFCMFIYGMYWVTKTLSYSIFYEDMVEQTIIEMVNPESLKQ
jgi:hypothetical protein